ncbi:MAG: dehydrogenase [Phormidesmis priestleyi]|uniref:Dehydrogenase n=1 Tax=Phormidesmis priestleyi TaxID=268141 RepID=A0A2W4WXM5_9CYAN|nr:MAG: dehydrogenase [Phormidesmis priestleyi]
MSQYDCIIVGAGPAGASAAYHLSRKGHRVLLLEKAALPRYKPCGGGVSPQIADWFDFDFEPVISQKVTRARYTWKLEDAVEADLGVPIWMVRRNEFDHYIVQQAQAKGAVLQDATKATGIVFDRNCWQVTTSRNETVSGTYLIAADGARGPMAKWLGFKARQAKNIGGAIEIEPRGAVENGHVVHFEFGLLKNGYVWNFPKRDGYSIGSGVFHSGRDRKSNDLLQPMVDYAAAFGVDGDAAKKHGHPVCIWQGDQILHAQNALLAGEAACMVDPFTAEGIRPSIFTGIKAAEAIDRASAGEANALENYTSIVNTELGSEMRMASRLAKAFYTAPRLGYRVIMKQPGATKAMMKILTGELKYADMVHKALRKISGGLLAG